MSAREPPEEAQALGEMAMSLLEGLQPKLDNIGVRATIILHLDDRPRIGVVVAASAEPGTSCPGMLRLLADQLEDGGTMLYDSEQLDS